MTWFHVDDGFHSHPKALATSLAARGLWVTAGSWSGDHLTDGFISDHVLASLGGTGELATELVTSGLWRRVRNGYQFHQWTDNGNPSKEAVDNQRAKWRESKKPSSARVTSTVETRGNPRGSPPRSPPVPIPVPIKNGSVVTGTDRGYPQPSFKPRFDDGFNGAASRHPSSRTAAEAIAEANHPAD